MVIALMPSGWHGLLFVFSLAKLVVLSSSRNGSWGEISRSSRGHLLGSLELLRSVATVLQSSRQSLVTSSSLCSRKSSRFNFLMESWTSHASAYPFGIC